MYMYVVIMQSQAEREAIEMRPVCFISGCFAGMTFNVA